jgi:hypothetical protein
MPIGTHFPRKLLGLLLATATLVSPGCDRDRHAGEENIYRGLRSEILELYLDTNPLRASQSGFTDADSLLYVYAREDLETTISRIKRLDERLRRLTISHLDEREIEDTRMLLMWLKGERYGLEKLQYYRYNPLLYCWIVGEALWGIPSRPEPPYEGELSAYEGRISQIPELLGNASAAIDNPPRPYVKLAAQHMRKLLDDLPALEATLENRYARRVALSETITRSMTGFLGFLEGTLSSQTRGYMILGSENISKIFLYDEGVELDPAGMIQEAEARIRRITTEQANVKRSAGGAEDIRRSTIEAGGPALLGLVLETVEDREKRQSRTRSGMERPFEVHFVEKTGLSQDVPKSANITLPPVIDALRSSVCIRTTLRPPCSQFLLVDEDQSGIGLLYDLLEALSEREPRMMRCLRADTIRTLFGSSLYRHTVRFMEIEDLIDAFPAEKQLLDEILADEEIRALSRTVVVLELHAGIFTPESATEYLMRKVHISREEADAEVARAYYAPEIAYPGIALLTMDRMAKKASSTRGAEPAEERLRTLLIEKYYAPLQLIWGNIQDE